MIRQISIALTCALLGLGVCWIRHDRSLPLTPYLGLSLGTITRVSPAGSGENIQQIWAAADPTDSRYLMVCGGDSYPSRNIATGYLYSSADNGTSWHRAINDRATRFISEESCTYDSDGRTYFAAGESDTSMGEPRHEWGHLHLFTSRNHGITWSSLWKRKDGWMDWTSMAAAPATGNHPSSLVVFANRGTDTLGHWLLSRPVAIVSHNDGRTFSGLLSPQQVSGPGHIAAVWTSGSTVLPDGSALFSTAAWRSAKEDMFYFAKHGDTQVRLFAYNPSTGRIGSRAVIRTEKTAGAFIVSMARDSGRNRFAGRLYLSWTAFHSSRGTGTLWLATSDDGGYHWQARAVSTEGCLGDVKLATTPNGTVGIIWSQTDTHIRFAVSRDGGHTFNEGTTIVQHGLGQLKADQAVSFNEIYAAEVQATKEGTAQRESDFLDDKHLGLSIRLSRQRAIDDYAVVSDTRGVFHVLWSQLEPDGTHALFTRTVHATSDVLPEKTSLSSFPMCAKNRRGAFSTLRRMPLLRAPDGEQDITRLLVMYIQNLQYDSATHMVSADITLKNKGKSVVRGPITFVGLGVHSDYGTAAVANATGTIQNQPYWDASTIIPVSGLQPGATSAPLPLHFKIEHFKPIPDMIHGGDGVAMWAKIYQKQ